MTANEIIKQLQSITDLFNTGEIPVREMKFKEVNLKFEIQKDKKGEYYIEMMYIL